MVRPPTDDSDAEDAMERALRAELCASTAPGKAHEKNAEEGPVKEATEVGGGDQGGRRWRRGHRREPRPRGLVLVFIFIHVRVY